MEFLRKLFSSPQPLMPLGSLAWVGALKDMDEIPAIEHATQQLNNDAKNNLFHDDVYLDALFSADEKTRIIVEKITSHYLNIDNISIELEERMANTVFLYHRQLFLIYVSLIENLTDSQPKSLTVMLARAINSATEMIKWRYYNYQSAPANVWLQLSKLYLIAEKLTLLEVNVQAYQDQEVTTLSSLYMHACMLGSLESLSFKRQQIDLVSKILANWTPKTLIEKVFDEKKQLFYVDTASDMPARRIRNFKPANSFRYWCFDSINKNVELCLSMIEFNITPKQRFMSELMNHKYTLATLEILKTEWSRVEYKRQRRDHERLKSAKTATTVFGFENTCYHIKQYSNTRVQRDGKQYQGNKSFDERLAAHHIRKDYSDSTVMYFDLGAGQSSVVDESINGIGLHINKQASEVSLGMMVGISIQGHNGDTIVGTIRSIKPIIGNELHIGVEILSKKAFCVDAKNISRIAFKPSTPSNPHESAFANTVNLTKKDFLDTASFDSKAANFTCLCLPKEQNRSNQDTIILHRLNYNKNDTYKINILGEDVIANFTETLEHHENWLQVTYTKELETNLI